jgi:oxygen-dependent protoporphyrinogen oxidase
MRVAVVGGGISGLGAAWFLSRQGHEVHLYEASDRLGGWVHSERVNGYLFEHGPRSFRLAGSRGAQVLSWMKELGIEKELLFPEPCAQRRFLYLNKKVQPLPHNFLSTITSPFMPALARAGCKRLLSWSKTEEDESIASYCRRQFGEEALRLFADPLITGIYAGNPDQLSVRSCFPKRDKSKHRLPAPFFSFREGMGRLIEVLGERCKAEIHLNTPVQAVRSSKKGGVILTVGKEAEFDHIFMTVPGSVAGKILGEEWQPLLNIPTTSVAVVNLAYEGELLPNQGFGYLVPSSEKEPILGVIWQSSVFPTQQPKNSTVLNVMLGGVRAPYLAEEEEGKLFQLAQEAIARHLTISAEPIAKHLVRAKQAIPQYLVGHEKRLQKIDQQTPPWLTLLGSGYRGVSLGDCLCEAERSIPRAITNS